MDIKPSGDVYIHLYQVPTFAIIVIRDVTCGGNIDCTVQWLRYNVSMSGPADQFWNDALDNKDQLYNAISVSKRSFEPRTGWLQCLMIYSVWTTGWGNSSDGRWCKHG